MNAVCMELSVGPTFVVKFIARMGTYMFKYCYQEIIFYEQNSEKPNEAN